MKKRLSSSLTSAGAFFDSKSRSGPAEVDALAGDLLAFLAADDERLNRFFAVTGLGPETLRAASRGAHFAESLLDYLAGDETMLIAFAAQHDLAPAEIARLRQSLAPRDEPW